MNRPDPADRWTAYRQPRAAALVRLYCFPYAGGSASVYRTWARDLPQEIEVVPVQLPGRESRIRERPLTSMDELVAALDEGLGPQLDRAEPPFAFFGHSMGAIAAFELARRRRDAGRSEPVHLFASAHSAPQVPDPEPPIHDLPNPRFRERLRELNGTPAEVLDHPELMDLVEPLLRADFRINETYEYHPGEPLSAPLTIFGGAEDGEVPRERLAPWSEVTRGASTLRILPGDHFFLTGPARAELLRLIAVDLLA
ncbi:MAG TPA: alpha/beta fold hydrolase [Thermoanaerobaculia bacterium]|nr:alpha/beta fold hydrolase [Thermoanaerobaculia bacterium]